MDISNLDLLLSIITEDGKMSKEDVLNIVTKMKNEKIIKEHQEHYEIWQGTNNGRWYTYLPDKEKKDGRRLIAKSSKEKLTEAIIEYYTTDTIKFEMTKITLATLYKEWLPYKAKHIPSTRSLRIIDEFWKKYYANTLIINIPIINLRKLDLDNWAHDIIHRFDMTKKEYYNMAIIFRQSLDYAVEKDILPINPFNSFKIDSKLFRKFKKKPSNTQVFLTDEQPLIEDTAFQDFSESGYTACLGIPLSRQLGTRIGEIVALEWNDINDEVQDYIHIQRMESKEEKQDEQGNWIPANIIVAEHTKS